MKKFKGFTLVELAVVLVIIGVIGIIITLAIRNESNKISQGTSCLKRLYTSKSKFKILHIGDFHHYN